jgi:hypothetical protein
MYSRTHFSGPLNFFSACLIQRPPFSSAYHSPATAVLQRPTVLQRRPFSSNYHSPAPAIFQQLPFSSPYVSPATTFLRLLHFSGEEQKRATLHHTLPIHLVQGKWRMERVTVANCLEFDSWHKLWSKKRRVMGEVGRWCRRLITH